MARMTARKGLNFSEFTVDSKESIARRAAQALAWAAHQFPLEYASYQQLTQAVMGYGRMPSAKSQEVERLRKVMSTGVRKVLEEKYGMELISQPGIGVRATVDDTDRLRSVLPKKANRLKSARASFAKTANNIDIARVPSTPENAALKAWFNQDVKAVLKQIGSKEFEKKLLPPGATAPEAKD